MQEQVDTSPSLLNQNQRPISGDRPSIATKRMRRSLARFRTPSVSRSWLELVATLLPLIIVFGGILFAVSAGYYLALILTPLAGLFLLRTFII